MQQDELRIEEFLANNFNMSAKRIAKIRSFWGYTS